MRTFSGKRSTLALAIAGVTAMSGFMAMPEARAEGFIDDSTLTGGIYYWQRERDRKDVTDGDKYKTNQNLMRASNKYSYPSLEEFENIFNSNNYHDTEWYQYIIQELKQHDYLPF